MRYIDVCSGISAPTMAWKPLGWKALCFAEIEAAPRAVLKHHYPDTPLNGDFTKIRGDEYGPVDLLVGGTPCQSFSVAGLRGGLADERGNLALEYLRLADRSGARWLVWENVPGVLSSNGGRDFGTFLGGLAQLGYGFAYRVLDAQHFGVPQRRRRVFVVGHLGDWRRAAAVLFERHSLSGDTPPRRAPREGIADLAPHGPGSQGSGARWSSDGRPAAQAFGGGANCHPTDVATAVAAHPGGRYDIDCETFIAHSLRAEGFDASEDGTGRGTPLVPCFAATDYEAGSFERVEVAAPLTTSADRTRAAPIAFSAKDHGADASDISPTLRAGGHSGSHANAGVMPAVAFDLRGREDGSQLEGPHDTANLRAASGGSSRSYVAASAVRRLTPRECERLQGFPDDFTLVPYRNGMMADGPRYKMLGNSMAVPVVRWIGERIQKVESLTAMSEAA